LRETVFLQLKTKNPFVAKGKTADDFVLKVTGFSDWLITDSGTCVCVRLLMKNVEQSIDMT